MVDKDYDDVSGTRRVKWVFVGWLECEVEMEHSIFGKKGSRFQTADLQMNLGSKSSL